jgi:hypothetical protein
LNAPALEIVYAEAEMKLDIPDEYVPLVVTALEHYHAYTRAMKHEDARYLEAAEWFKKKQPSQEEPERTTERKRASKVSLRSLD